LIHDSTILVHNSFLLEINIDLCMNLFDIACNFTSDRFDNDLGEVIDKAIAQNKMLQNLDLYVSLA